MPRHTRWSQVARAAFISAAVAGATGCATTTRSMAASVTPAGVRFVFEDPMARSVAVAGSFNQWSSSAHPLARTVGRTEWAATVALPPGDHAYMFVVDGTRWVTPPAADDFVDDGFGARNGVVVVRDTER